ncbi:hypothetical protein [Brevibacillus nitrificans]|uniref:hypothetical protein n=1 Tax=Brevibacillus nitrificans TaxID=651560 RepID=UPI0026263210|nr:hypothetical protein [Brevibacillus nitrificans]
MKIALSILSIIALFSIFVVKYLWAHEPQFWKYGVATGDVVFNLSVGYISAFIFYVIDVWIPRKKEQERINNRIAVPLSRILHNIHEPIINIHNKASSESYQFDKITKEKLKEWLGSINLITDEGPLYLMDIQKNATFGQYLFNHVKLVNEYIDKINKLPVGLDIGLVELLDKIQASAYHEGMNSVQKYIGFVSSSNAHIQGEIFSESLYEYYGLYFELKNYMKKNKIQITIKDLP